MGAELSLSMAAGARELDDDVLLCVHAVLGEPGEMAQGAAGGGRRRRCRGGSRSVMKANKITSQFTNHGVQLSCSCSAQPPDVSARLPTVAVEI
uniref:Uncharacterized protein n=1 Tax=Oryza brachyantha TaxID=4533 RepID=J3KYB9_ORYBR